MNHTAPLDRIRRVPNMYRIPLIRIAALLNNLTLFSQVIHLPAGRCHWRSLSFSSSSLSLAARAFGRMRAPMSGWSRRSQPSSPVLRCPQFRRLPEAQASFHACFRDSAAKVASPEIHHSARLGQAQTPPPLHFPAGMHACTHQCFARALLGA